MDELLVYASRRSLRQRQLGALVVAGGLVAVIAFDPIDLDTVHVVLAAALVLVALATLAALEQRARDGLPELRLSIEGVEGAFGLIRWKDTSGAELLTRLRVRPRGVVVQRLDQDRTKVAKTSCPPSASFAIAPRYALAMLAWRRRRIASA